MNRIVRAGGFAAAALALAATANFTDASQATGSTSAPAVHYLAHADATTTAPVTADPARIAEFAGRVAGFAYSAVPRPRSLAELVELYQTTQTIAGEQDCLAKAVYFEARSEPLEGQLAVADVVLNRAASGKYPQGVCEVITQKAQFSFIEKGQFPEPNKASKAWSKAVAVARVAQNDLAEAVPEEVLWYHADYVAPVWRHGLKKSEQIGVHIFYGPRARS